MTSAESTERPGRAGEAGRPVHVLQLRPCICLSEGAYSPWLVLPGAARMRMMEARWRIRVELTMGRGRLRAS